MKNLSRQPILQNQNFHLQGSMRIQYTNDSQEAELSKNEDCRAKIAFDDIVTLWSREQAGYGCGLPYHHCTAPCVHSADIPLLPALFVIHNRPFMRLSRPVRPQFWTCVNNTSGFRLVGCGVIANYKVHNLGGQQLERLAGLETF